MDNLHTKDLRNPGHHVTISGIPEDDLAIISLCTRLSYIPEGSAVITRGSILYASDRFQKKRNGKDPLKKGFRLLRYLSQQDQDIFLSGHQIDPIYDRIRAAWVALGTTVLLHPQYLPDEEYGSDFLLMKSIKIFKIWFFKECFRELSICYREDGTSCVVAPHCDSTITKIKCLTSWMTYYGSFEPGSIRPKRTISCLPGHQEMGNQIFGWYGGHLSQWRKPWLLEATKENIFILSQMASFGRALPPCSGAIALDVGKKTFQTLTNEPVFNTNWLPVFRKAAVSIAKRMARPSMLTHCSFSSSSCYERIQEDGGMASYVVDEVNEFLRLPFKDLLPLLPGKKLPDVVEKLSMFSKKGSIPKVTPGLFSNSRIYDAFGRIAIVEGVSLIELSREAAGIPGLTLGDILYRTIDAAPCSGKDATLVRYMRPNCCYQNQGGLPYDGRPIGTQKETFACKNCKEPNIGVMTCSQINIEMLRQVRVLVGISDPYAGRYLNEVLGDVVSLWAFRESLQYGSFDKPHIGNFPLFEEEGVRQWIQEKPIETSFMVLAEPGWKARPLTKSQVWLTITEQLCRHSVEAALQSDPRCGLGFNSSYVLWDMLKFLNNLDTKERFTFINSDLKSATDNLPTPLLKVLWEGLFEGLGVTPDHPLYVYSGNQVKDYTIEWFKISGLQKRGSFMGTPLSFLGLTIYNLCIVEVSTNLVNFNNCQISPPQEYEHQIVSGASYDAIVGDDLLRVILDKRLKAATRLLYQETCSELSDGKYTESNLHGILCENHVYYSHGTKRPFQYLDIIKARLLTDSCRYHSDNRSSIIGKGSALFSQLEWYRDTNKAFSWTADRAQTVYSRILLNVVQPWIFKKMAFSGIHLPHSCGGLQFPMKWDQVQSTYKSQLDFLWWIAKGAPYNEFLAFHIEMRSVHGIYKRGLTVPDYSKIYREYLNRNLPTAKGFDPKNIDCLYSLYDVLRFYLQERKDIAVSAYTGLPHIHVVLKDLQEQYGFLSLDGLLDQWDRYFCFYQAFSSEEIKPQRYTFWGYVKNVTNLWSRHPKPGWDETHQFKSFSDLSWTVAMRAKTLIHKSHCRESILSAGPTLNVSLRRRDGILPIKHTQEAWESILEQTKNASTFGHDSDEPTDMVSHLQKQMGLVLTEKGWELV